MQHQILVVDDQKDVAETIAGALSKQGYHVEIAYDGDGCIAKMKQKSIQLLFLDIMLPGIDGETIAKRLRNEYHDKIKIVYITIKPKAEVNIEAVDGFIQKPFKIMELLKEAERNLAKL